MENENAWFVLIVIALMLVSSWLGVNTANAQTSYPVTVTAVDYQGHRSDVVKVDKHILPSSDNIQEMYTLYLSETKLIELVRGEIYAIDPELQLVKTTIINDKPSEYTWGQRYVSDKFEVEVKASLLTNSVTFNVFKK